MARKIRTISSGIAPVMAAAAVIVVAFGCSESLPDGSEAPVGGSQAAPASSAAGGGDGETSESGEGAASGPASAQATEPELGADRQPAAGSTTTAAPADASSPADAGGPIRSTRRESVASALRKPDHTDHPEPLVALSEIQGVVPPDAIPALEDPAFEPAVEVDWLSAAEPVLALEINGDARAYPLRIMTWHELVNGTVGGVPVTVSYCPLCNSAVAYDRRVGQRILDFGTSGALLNSSLVMYDRQTESLWSHYTGQAVVGHLTGTKLDLIPVQTVSFEAFLSAYPGGQVLSLDTGHFRRYGQNPYEYYDSNSRPFLFGGPFDDRLDPIARVVALRDDGEGAVIPHAVLAERRVVPFAFAGRELVALYEPGTASALDAPVIAEGRDVGATGVFVASLDGQPLALSPSDDGGFVNAATGVVYDILGRPADSPDAGVRLESVEHLDTFWFAAAAFYSDAEIIGQ